MVILNPGVKSQISFANITYLPIQIFKYSIMKEINSNIYRKSYFLKFLDATVSVVATDLLHKPVYPQLGQPSNQPKYFTS